MSENLIQVLTNQRNAAANEAARLAAEVLDLREENAALKRRDEANTATIRGLDDELTAQDAVLEDMQKRINNLEERLYDWQDAERDRGDEA